MSKEFEDKVLEELAKSREFEKRALEEFARNREFEKRALEEFARNREFEKRTLKELDKSRESEEGALEEFARNREFEKRTLEEFSKLNTRLDKIDDKLEEHSKKIGKMELDISELTEVVKFNTSCIIKLENEFGTKINTLFDAYTTNEEERLANLKSIVNLKEKAIKHDFRISALEDLTQGNLKLLKI